MTAGPELLGIARRRELLSARAQAQRLAVAGHVAELSQPIAIADGALGVARFLRAHSLLVVVVAAAAALVALRGRGLAGLAGRFMTGWRLWRMVSPWLRR